MIITCNISKGGNGKTTTVATISQILAFAGYKVLDVDLDLQRNLSFMLAHQNDLKQSHSYTVEDLMLQCCTINELEEAVISTKIANIDLIPSVESLEKTPYLIHDIIKNEENGDAVITCLRKNLLTLQEKNHYDFILIDTTPSISYVSYEAIAAADQLLIPIEADNFSYRGIIDTINLMSKLNHEHQLSTELLGVFMTRVDTRTNRFKQISSGYRSLLGDKFLDTYIKRCEPVAQSSTSLEPLLLWDPKCNAVEDYTHLCQDAGLLDGLHYLQLKQSLNLKN